MPNPNIRSGMSPVELMFTRKIKSMFNKILPELKAQTSKNILINYTGDVLKITVVKLI